MELAKKLKNEVLHFTDRMEDMLSHYDIDVDDLIYVKLYFKMTNEIDVMNHIVEDVLPWKKQIKERNEDFFCSNKQIFGKLPSKKLNFFSKHIKDGTFDEDDKQEVWDFFEVFVTFAEEYKKKV